MESVSEQGLTCHVTYTDRDEMEQSHINRFCYHFLDVYRKISNTIRTIFTKNRGTAAGVRIIHRNEKNA